MESTNWILILGQQKITNKLGKKLNNLINCKWWRPWLLQNTT